MHTWRNTDVYSSVSKYQIKTLGLVSNWYLIAPLAREVTSALTKNYARLQ